jgi:type II secretory pathway pseudopilin PulG
MNDAPQIMDQTDKKVFTIILVVVGVICIVIAGATAVAFYAVNTANEKQKASLATEQAHATSTAVSVTSTAVYQVTQVAGYQFFDDFDDNKNNWSHGVENNKYWRGSISVRDGMYVWDIRSFHGLGASRSWRDFEANTYVDNFDMSVDAKLQSLTAQSPCYAVAFRTSTDGVGNGAYIFSVCNSGWFYVNYSDERDEQLIIPFTHSTAFRPGDWNTLAVSARDDHFVLSINSVVVSEFDDSHREGGYVYLVVIAKDNEPGTVMFDNFGLQPR